MWSTRFLFVLWKDLEVDWVGLKGVWLVTLVEHWTSKLLFQSLMRTLQDAAQYVL